MHIIAPVSYSPTFGAVVCPKDFQLLSKQGSGRSTSQYKLARNGSTVLPMTGLDVKARQNNGLAKEQ